MLPVNFAFSPCPNDTFAFHAIVHGLVPGIRVTPHLDDIEALNIRAAGPDAEVTKVSINAYGHDLLTNNHRKNGPPMSAVTTPTGISSGDISVRAARSHNTRKAAPNRAEAGSTIR